MAGMAGRHRRTDGGKRAVETSDYVAMLERLLITWGDRVADDPAALVHLRQLQQALTDNTNRGIFQANRGAHRYSQNEMAAFLAVTRQAIQKRIGLGETVYAELETRRGGGALVRIGDVRRARAQLLEQAGVDDRTGSVLELRARAI